MVSELVGMLLGDADSVSNEVPGLDKAETGDLTGGCQEFHQMKPSHPNGTRSLISLYADAMMSAFVRALAGDQHRFVPAWVRDARGFAIRGGAPRGAGR